jgi:iron complex transport system permease protein
MRHLTSRRLAASLGAVALATAAALAAALALGPVGSTIRRAFSDPAAMAILVEVRGPRVLLGALVGGSLALAGAAFQALLRNPLADPFILGVSGGAAVGAVGALLLRGAAAAAALGPGAATPLFAFAGALLATVLVYLLARAGPGMSGERLLLTGVVVNAFLSALILLLAQMAGSSRRLLILRWMTGNLGSIEVGARELAVLGAIAAAGLAAFLLLARDLDLLSLGDRAAEDLGVDVGRTRAIVFFAGSLVTGAAVAWSGIIGFVGLIVPHALRLIFGPDHRLLVPAAFLAGAGFLALADGAARSILPWEELPVGVITALTGGPFFLYLLVSRKRGFGVGPEER